MNARPTQLDSHPSSPAAAEELSYRVDGISCGHCEVAVSGEVGRLAGVGSVEVDLERKLVRVRGLDLDDAAVRAAIDEAGYDAVPA
ncbi:MAG TPA: cation transporter [Solirubrobacterales bacterium]|nr:cation transporter [Solirubrobacterales bacterium]